MVEKASCDEGFFDVTREVEYLYHTRKFNFNESWHGAVFMGNKATFVPETEQEKKLFVANWFCAQMRAALHAELGYRASAGVSFNKTVAKIAGSQNKPNGQTIVPLRYIKEALAPVKISKIRFFGGKVSELFGRLDMETIGQI